MPKKNQPDTYTTEVYIATTTRRKELLAPSTARFKAGASLNLTNEQALSLNELLVAYIDLDVFAEALSNSVEELLPILKSAIPAIKAFAGIDPIHFANIVNTLTTITEEKTNAM